MRPLKEKVSITLDSDLVRETKKLAEENERSFSQYINLVMRKHLQKIAANAENKKDIHNE